MIAAIEAKIINPKLVKKANQMLGTDVHGLKYHIKICQFSLSDPDAFIHVAFACCPEIQSEEQYGNKHPAYLDRNFSFQRAF